jgi:hypothetical protein
MRLEEFHNVDFREAKSDFAEDRPDWRGPLSLVLTLIGFVTLKLGIWGIATLCSASGLLLGVIAVGVARGARATPVSGLLSIIAGAPCTVSAAISWLIIGTHLHAWC